MFLLPVREKRQNNNIGMGRLGVWRRETKRRMGLRLTNLVIYTFYVVVLSFLLLGWVISIPYLHYTYNVLFAKLDTKTISNETPRGNYEVEKISSPIPQRFLISLDLQLLMPASIYPPQKATS